jgi:hypothetical protein
MRLGGWTRLWMAVTVAYGAVVVAIAIVFWPSLLTIPHDPTFLDRLSSEAAAGVRRPMPKTMRQLEEELLTADEAGRADEVRRLVREIKERRAQPVKDEAITLELPNGHRLLLAGSLNDEDLSLIGREYTKVLNDELFARRLYASAKFLGIWLVPSLLLLAAGCTVSWIRAGFRDQS